MDAKIKQHPNMGIPIENNGITFFSLLLTQAREIMEFHVFFGMFYQQQHTRSSYFFCYTTHNRIFLKRNILNGRAFKTGNYRTKKKRNGIICCCRRALVPKNKKKTKFNKIFIVLVNSSYINKKERKN